MLLFIVSRLLFCSEVCASGVDAAFDAIVEDSRGEWVLSCYVVELFLYNLYIIIISF